MARHEPEWWAERLEEVARGESSKDVAERYGVREKTLLWWRSELERRRRKQRRTRLLPVVVAETRRAPASMPSVTGLVVEVEVGAARMTLRGAVAPEHLAAIVTASMRAC